MEMEDWNVYVKRFRQSSVDNIADSKSGARYKAALIIHHQTSRDNRRWDGQTSHWLFMQYYVPIVAPESRIGHTRGPKIVFEFPFSYCSRRMQNDKS